MCEVKCVAMDMHQKYLIAEQYKNANNLEARIALHAKFSTSKHDYHQWLFDYIKTRPFARVLELGSGSAKLWQVNGEHIPLDWTITLSDFSEEILEDTRKNVIAVSRKFTFKVMDAQNILFDDKIFDIVIANHMLYHVPDIDKAISEIRRVLKPDGRFYAGTGGLGHMKEMDDFIEEHMASRLHKGFERMGMGRFALENGAQYISKHFENVNVHKVPESHLHVTEVEPFMAYILSMARWSALTKDIAKGTVDEVVSNARTIAEEKLPIHITTSSGLFEAW
jgi:ubiquinone/menaquinone biosynthesis C-methylase UbiE